jgi:2,4-dienoyl-CoA reductase-like NADH-dependent reductase (Old Yellow Enzyme family)
LTHQFLSATTNLRTDDYGGTPEKRMRFAIEVVERVRQSWPHNKPLFFRTSAVDEVGWTIEDSINLAKVLKAKGVDVFDCSSGGMSEKSAVLSPVKPSYSYQVPYSEKIRHGADIMTMAVGLIIHADQAEHILQKGQADIVAIGREMLHNPNWALDAAIKLGQDNPYAKVPESYAYWLEKRADVGFKDRTSTWLKGIDAPQV